MSAKVNLFSLRIDDSLFFIMNITKDTKCGWIVNLFYLLLGLSFYTFLLLFINIADSLLILGIVGSSFFPCNRIRLVWVDRLIEDTVTATLFTCCWTSIIAKNCGSCIQLNSNEPKFYEQVKVTIIFAANCAWQKKKKNGFKRWTNHISILRILHGNNLPNFIQNSTLVGLCNGCPILNYCIDWPWVSKLERTEISHHCMQIAKLWLRKFTIQSHWTDVICCSNLNWFHHSIPEINHKIWCMWIG